jgi:Ni/Fe-hydrogenase subunit HybB-like protein
MFVYLFLKALTILHGRLWPSLGDAWGAWYLLEVVGLVAVPMVMLLLGAAKRHLRLIRGAALLAILGVILNRLNVSVIAFKWYETAHYVPSWMEIVVSAGVICAEIWVFRWVVLRMPVVSRQPPWARKWQYSHRAGQPSPDLAA